MRQITSIYMRSRLNQTSNLVMARSNRERGCNFFFWFTPSNNDR